MGTSKVVLGSNVLVDLTNDTVTAETLAEGTTAHGADGEPIVGTYAGIDTSDATAEATDIVQGKTAYVNGEKITGNVTVKSDGTIDTADRVSLTVYAGGEATASPTNGTATGTNAQFTDVSNITADDDTYASLSYAGVASNIALSASASATLNGFDFGAISSSAKIKSVTATIKYRLSSTTGISNVNFKIGSTSQALECSTTKTTAELEFHDLDILPDEFSVAIGASGSTNSTRRYVYIYYISLDIVADTAYDVKVEKQFSEGVMISQGNYYGLTASTISAETGGGSQSGTDTSDATATAADILSGKTAYVNGEKITGTIATATAPTPTISVSAAGLITASVSNPAGYQASATTKSATSQLTTKAATTYTPTTTNQTIASKTYLTGVQTIQGDANLVSGNIKSGVSIFGVAGSYAGSGSDGSSSNNCEAYYTEDTAPVVNFQRTDGTIKVWGYGSKTSGYMTTTYTFVGDGYYSGMSYGTPSKTTLTLSVDSSGNVSGLPSGITTAALLFTKGI